MGFAEGYLGAQRNKILKEQLAAEEKLNQLRMKKLAVEIGMAQSQAQARSRLFGPDSSPMPGVEGPPAPDASVLDRIAAGQTSSLRDLFQSGLADEFSRFQQAMTAKEMAEMMAGVTGGFAGGFAGAPGAAPAAPGAAPGAPGPGFGGRGITTLPSITMGPDGPRISLRSQGPESRPNDIGGLDWFHRGTGEFLGSTGISEAQRAERSFMELVPAKEQESFYALDPETGAITKFPPQPGMTRADKAAAMQGGRLAEVTDAAARRKLEASILTKQNIEQNLQPMIKVLFTAKEGFAERAWEAGANAWAKFVQDEKGAMIKTYESQLDALSASFVKLMGDSGALSDTDIKRGKKLFPKLRNWDSLGLPDSATTAALKMEAVTSIIAMSQAAILGIAQPDIKGEIDYWTRVIEQQQKEDMVGQTARTIDETVLDAASIANQQANEALDRLSTLPDKLKEQGVQELPKNLRAP